MLYPKVTYGMDADNIKGSALDIRDYDPKKGDGVGSAIDGEILILSVISVLTVDLAIPLFERTIAKYG